MKWQHVTIQLPQGPYLTLGLILGLLAMLFWNIGMMIAMRYERRVR